MLRFCSAGSGQGLRSPAVRNSLGTGGQICRESGNDTPRSQLRLRRRRCPGTRITAVEARHQVPRHAGGCLPEARHGCRRRGRGDARLNLTVGPEWIVFRIRCSGAAFFARISAIGLKRVIPSSRLSARTSGCWVSSASRRSCHHFLPRLLHTWRRLVTHQRLRVLFATGGVLPHDHRAGGPMGPASPTLPACSAGCCTEPARV